MKPLNVIFLVTLVLLSCQESKKPQKTINGTWKSLGSGWILDIKDSTQYALYDLTRISCLPNRKANLSEIMHDLSLGNDTLSLLKGVITYKFVRTDTIPKLCSNVPTKKKRNDPLYNFEVFSETVREHYAFMELNGIAWDTLYLAQKEKLRANPTEVTLYQVLDETLEKLNDNHAYLEATDEIYDTLEQLTVAEEINEKMDTEAEIEYGDLQIAGMVKNHYLLDEFTEDSKLIQWGKLTNTIGYIQVMTMWLHADLDIPKELIDEKGYLDAYVNTFHKMYEGDYIDKEKKAVRHIMDRVMQDLGNMQSIVIDIRFNGGGQDAVSFEILNRFTEKRLHIANQKLYYGNRFSPVLPLYLEGTLNAYTKPVYVLTSPQTGSAAEAFALATMAMPHIKRIGAPTSGALSTALEKTLPNGWAFSISNEIYMDTQDHIYENRGIPVDYELDYPRNRQPFFRKIANTLEKDKEDVLKAIDQLEGLKD